MRIPIACDAGNYDVVLSSGCLKCADELLDLNRKVLIVTDTGVPEVYARTVSDRCAQSVVVRIAQGEANKNLDSFQYLLKAMLDAGFTRSDCVVAVGGGVAGDLAGFAASCYMRGIDFYNIPTTLLAQVDSSIGGKTAVDFCGVKNVVGAFYPPKRVLIDPDVLDTLPRRQLRSGLAEAVKMAVTFDENLFRRIEETENAYEILPEIIQASLLIKKNVVEQDPREQGLRRALNFGHTVGHAVESLAGGALLHGECVALGMLLMCAPDMRERLKNLLTRLGLPVRIEWPTGDLLPFLLHDKKKRAETIVCVLSDKIGTFRFAELTPREILTRLEESL